MTIRRKQEFSVEWDSNKSKLNFKKHHISFETAVGVFSDINRIEYFDHEHSLYEDRYIVIGCVGNILFVVYTVRNETIRLISARIANEKERRLYYER